MNAVNFLEGMTAMVKIKRFFDIIVSFFYFLVYLISLYFFVVKLAKPKKEAESFREE